MKHLIILSVLLLVIATSLMGCKKDNNNAQANNGEGNEIPFDDARIIIELNSTDGDSGIQLFVDGEGWDELEVMSPDMSTILHVMGDGSVGLQGLTELFFESAEPSFDVLPFDEFLARFPEGVYTLMGTTVDGDQLVGLATLTHNVPAGPEIVSPEEDEVVDPEDVVIDWDPVIDQFANDSDIEITGYQVIVENEEGPLRVLSIDLPASVTEVTVPPQFLEPDTEYKFEVLAKEESGNQTITESTFFTMP
jgi:hypothetical protein